MTLNKNGLKSVLLVVQGKRIVAKVSCLSRVTSRCGEDIELGNVYEDVRTRNIHTVDEIPHPPMRRNRFLLEPDSIFRFFCLNIVHSRPVFGI